MNTRDSAFAYQQSNAISASAVGQVVALYDRILQDLRHALQAVETGDIEKRVQTMTHALTIVGELQGVLDFERGGASAKHLNGFYNVARAMMMQAGVTCSTATMQELVAMFTRLRAAWAKAEQNVKPAEPMEGLRVSSQSQTSQPPVEEAVAESGSWRA